MSRAARFIFHDMRLFKQRALRARTWFKDRYFRADPRALGLFRIALGLCLLVDGIRHWLYAEDYYSNAGVLTNHFHLFRPSSSHNFSLFHAFSSPTEVHLAFALASLCYLALTLGYKTRLFSILSCVWVTSMDNRLVMVENGGYVVVNLLAFWGMFLPLGQRYSIDSLKRGFRHFVRTRSEPLIARARPAWLERPHVSLACFIVLLNLGIVYIFNVVNKYGSTWRKGQTVHYVLHIDRMVTGIAVFFRETLPAWSLPAISHSVLVVEALLIMLILWPRWRIFTRPAAMVLMWLLHGTFGIMMRLGPFSWFLLAWSFLLLQRTHMDGLTRWRVRKRGPVAVHLNPQSAFAHWWCDRLAALDTEGLIRIRTKRTGGSAPCTNVLWLVHERSGLRYEGRHAAQRMLERVGLGLLAPRAFSAPLAWLFGPLLAPSSSMRSWIERFFALRPPAHLPSERANTSRGLSPLGSWIARQRLRLREGVLFALLMMATSQLINENKSIPKPLKHKQPAFVRAIIVYPRIFQGWGMFSPNPIRDDGVMAVDAMTIDGRRIDPFTGRAPDLNLSDARGMGLGQIPQDYQNRIRLDRNRVFRKPLREYLQRYHERTGQAADELVSIDVYWLVDQSPKPGRLKPHSHKRICLLSWRKPRHRPKAGETKPPPKCKVESAGK